MPTPYIAIGLAMAVPRMPDPTIEIRRWVVISALPFIVGGLIVAIGDHQRIGTIEKQPGGADDVNVINKRIDGLDTDLKLQLQRLEALDALAKATAQLGVQLGNDNAALKAQLNYITEGQRRVEVSVGRLASRMSPTFPHGEVFDK